MATTLTKSFADLVAPKVSSLLVALIRQDGTECQGGGYQRQQVSTCSTSEDATYVYITNASDIRFPVASEDVAPTTNPITQLTLYDNASPVVTIDLSQSKAYLTQDQIIIPAGSLVIRFPKSNT
jgi:hypothetical protein